MGSVARTLPSTSLRAGFVRVSPLDAQPFAYLRRRQPCHSNYFIPASQSGCNSNGGSRYVQKLREKFDACLVGFAVHRRRGQGQFQRVAHLARDGVLLGPRVDLDGKRRTAGRTLNRYHRKASTTGYTGEHGVNRSGLPLCSSVPTGVKVLFVAQKSPSLRARRSPPLQSQLQNRATCPWKAHPCQPSAARARRCCLESDEVAGNRAASTPDLRCKAAQPSSRKF